VNASVVVFHNLDTVIYTADKLAC